MLARNKDLFKEYDNATPILVLAHALNTKPSISSTTHYISLIMKDYKYVFQKNLHQGYPNSGELSIK